MIRSFPIPPPPQRAENALSSNYLATVRVTQQPNAYQLPRQTQIQALYIPKPPPEARAFLIISKLITDVEQSVLGRNGDVELLRKCNTAYERFRSQIQGTAPRIVATGKKDASVQARITEVAKLEQQAHPVPPPPPPPIPPPSPTPSTTSSTASSSPSKRKKGKAVPAPIPTPVPPPAIPVVPKLALPPPFYSPLGRIRKDPVEIDKLAEHVKVVTNTWSPLVLNLDEVSEVTRRHITRELPYNVPFSAEVDIILRGFENWPKLAEQCLETVAKECCQVACRLIASAEGCGESWRSYRTRFLAEYKSKRPGVAKHDPYYAKEAINNLRAMGFFVRTLADLERLRPADVYEEEIILAAEARAYFQIAYKRIIDDIPRIIDEKFVRKVPKYVEATLYAASGLLV
ncbi:hypothetical protein DL93DRAFT_2168651 [Clavulina sp. PMI_390]|nr:hypothetical protein DL93DRAFT_2168651 [Clavulina sp. PMI_390]